MSVLERFGIIIDSNADQAAAANERLAKSLDDVEVAAGNAVEGTDKATEATEAGTVADDKKSAGLTVMAKRFLGVAAAIAAAKAALNGINASFSQTAGASRFADMMGLNTQELEKYGAAATLVGGDADATKSSAATLSNRMQSLKFSEESELFKQLQFAGSKVFNEDGTKKTFQQIFADLARATEGKTNAESFNRLSALGLDEGTIKLLQLGEAGMNAKLGRATELGLSTPAQDSRAVELAEAWAETSLATADLWRDLADQLQPSMLEFSRALLELTQTIRPVIDFLTSDAVTEHPLFKVMTYGAGEAGVDAYNFIESGEAANAAEGVKKSGLDWIKNFISPHEKNAEGKFINPPYQGASAPMVTDGMTRGLSAASAGNTVNIAELKVNASGNSNSTEIAGNIDIALRRAMAAVNANNATGILA